MRKDGRRSNAKLSTLRLPSDLLVLAYLAGILDGEGSITNHFSGRSDCYFVQVVTISNTDKPLIDWFASFGGSVYLSDLKRNPLGKKQCYKWELRKTREVREFLAALLPFIRIKRAKALEAIYLCDVRLKRGT